MKKTYDLTTNTHYQEVKVRKFSKMIMQESNQDILKCMVGGVETGNSTGTSADVISHFQAYYKRMGWDNICPFNPHGKLGYMYAIFKDKNCTNPKVRKEKYKKARPITPYCKHPMKRLLNLAARGWMFLIKQLQGNHFILPATKDLKSTENCANLRTISTKTSTET